VKKANENKLPSWNEAIKVNFRGLKLLFSHCGPAVISRLVFAAWKALSPYVTVWLSARLIDAIAFGKDPATLIRLAILTLASVFAAELVSALLEKWKNTENALRWHSLRHMYHQKFGAMDFPDADDPAVREKYTAIQNFMWGGNWGMNRLLNNTEKMISSFCSLFGGIALSVTLFTQTVPESGGKLTLLNNPVVVIAVILAMIGITYFAPRLSSRADSCWSRLANKHLSANKLFSYFGWDLFEDEHAQEMRIYSQEKFAEGYQKNVKFGLFCSKGELARISWRERGLLMAAGSALGVVFTGLSYVFVCLKALGGAFGVGMVTQYVGAISKLSGSVSGLVSSIGEMRNNAPFIENSLEFMSIPNKMYRGTLTVEKRRDRNYEIEFRNVSFKYPGSDAYALKNVSMKFRVGSRLAIVGQNGSGKSTFIKLLCRLYDPTEGEILLNGIDIRKYDYANYMSVFSVVFQDFRLLAFKLGENVGGCRDYDREKVLDSLEKAGFSERLATLPDGLDTWLYKNFEDGVNLSGGEAQKLAIARALYKNAPFIILDEPTAALDPMAEAEIYSRFNDISGDRTAIYISHRLSSTRFCDEIAVFHAGEIVQQGTHAGLLADEAGQYARLWNSQAQYYTES